jgi:hypothetical protein
MKYLKKLGLAALAAMALTAFSAGSASATTLEIGGVVKNETVTINASIKAGTSAILRDTFGFSVNTCTGSTVHGETTYADGVHNKYTGTRLTGPITSLTFSGCTNPVTVHKPGNLYIEHIRGTTNGTVFSEGAEVTVWSALHNTYINCKTGAGIHLGILTGVAKTTEHATMDINATLNCEPHLSSAKWTGTYTVTTPTGLGVVA